MSLISVSSSLNTGIKPAPTTSLASKAVSSKVDSAMAYFAAKQEQQQAQTTADAWSAATAAGEDTAEFSNAAMAASNALMNPKPVTQASDPANGLPNLSQYNVLQQAGIAALNQANNSNAAVLSLLKP